MEQIKSNVGYLFVVQITQYLVPLIVLPLLARTLGTEGVGIVSVALSVCALAFIVTDFGFSVVSPALIAQNKQLNGWLSHYLGAAFSIKLLLAVVLLLVIVFTGAVFTDVAFQHPLVFGAVVLSIFFQSFQLQWFFQGIERMRNIVLSVGLAKLIYLSLVVLFVRQPGDEGKVLLFFAFSHLVTLCISLCLVYREGYRFSKPSANDVSRIFKASAPFFASRTAVSIYTSASTFVVGSVSGYHQAALYSCAEKLYQALIAATAPISQALYPHLARARKDDLLMIFLAYTLPVVIGVAFGVAYFSEEIVMLLYGAEFAQASALLKVFAITAVISFIGINFGYPAYSTINRLDVVNKSVLIGGALQLTVLGALFGYSALNAINVALSVLAVEIVIMCFRVFGFFVLRKKAHV
ncbi:oligosaccharide flippase family protein [Vibrio hepatarius]|uniref:oligosaccharide flippase family protein n=1 Tax=Vibrio hepatarius TaxID=171383 RepID=UPI003734C61E